MKLRATLAAGLLAMIVGCNHNTQPARGPLSADRFEQAKNPPITAKTHFAAAQLAESEGRLGQAIQQYEQTLKLDPNYLDAMYRLGVVHAELKDYPGAIEAWQRYIRATGGSATAYSNLGFCQELAGNSAAAEAAYKQGIARDPKNEPCRINYGLMLARRGNAREALDQLLTVLPPAQAHYDLASIYEITGRKGEAREEYRKALQIDPDLHDAKTKLAALN
jgi:tetratricopeptide (TPR) repeat protein